MRVLSGLTALVNLSIFCNQYTYDTIDLEGLASLSGLTKLYIDLEFWNGLTDADRDQFREGGVDARDWKCSEPEPEPESESESAVKQRRYIRRCGLGWAPQSQLQMGRIEQPKVMIYALEFEYDPDRNAGYSCKAIEIRTGNDSIENLAGWKLYLGTLYNPSYSPLEIPEEHSQITDRVLRLTPEMFGLQIFRCGTGTLYGLSHPVPSVHYVLRTDENVLVDIAYSCFLWGQIAVSAVNGVNVKSPRRISSATLREMETPRLERYILDNTSIYINYMPLDEFTWDRAVLSDWLLPPSEETAPGAPSAIQRKLVSTWGALKKQ